MARPDWTHPSPETDPPVGPPAARARWEADDYLVGLPHPPPGPLADVANPLRIERTTPGDLLLVTIGFARTRRWAMRLPGPGLVRLHRRNAPPIPPPYLPGVPALAHEPTVQVADWRLPAGALVWIVALGRNLPEPHDAADEPHDAMALPAELLRTGLKKDASGWWRRNLDYTPSTKHTPACYSAWYQRITPDGTEAVEFVYLFQRDGLGSTLVDLDRYGVSCARRRLFSETFEDPDWTVTDHDLVAVEKMSVAGILEAAKRDERPNL